MPRRFFRKFAFKRHEVHDRWYMAPFRHLLHDHRLWGMGRRNVVPAFALGLFISFMPIPSHIIAAILLALVLRINIPVATLATFASNPATIGFMYYLAYRLGANILNVEERPFAFEASLEWLTHTFLTIWQPLLLGCFILGTAAATVGYVLLDLFWRLSIGNYKTEKRKKRRDQD